MKNKLNLLHEKSEELSDRHIVFTQDKGKRIKIKTVKSIELNQVRSADIPADENLTEVGAEKQIELPEQLIVNDSVEAKVIEQET